MSIDCVEKYCKKGGNIMFEINLYGYCNECGAGLRVEQTEKAIMVAPCSCTSKGMPDMQDRLRGIQDRISEIQDSIDELQDTKEELQALKDGLQDRIDELQDTKDELQDTKDELQDMKDELSWLYTSETK